MLTFSRRALLQSSFAAAAALAAGSARAQAFPSRPIRWIVPYAAGGGTDALARIVASSMGTAIGQPFIIENRPGAATNLGADAVAKAPPDGYAVLTADNGTLVNNQGMFAKLPFDADKDLRAVGLLARFHLVVAVTKASKIQTVQELVAKAKAEPSVLNYGTPGIGSPHHLAMERLASLAGAKLTHVAYRGAAPLLTDLLGGTVEVGMIDFAAGGETMRAGQIRPLAVCSAQRLAALPDVPTIQEALGIQGFEAHAWQGLMTTGKTPDDIAATLVKAHATAMRDETVRARMQQLGIEPLSGGPAEFSALVASERAIWLPVIKALGIRL